jgi:hypothetical protein
MGASLQLDVGDFGDALSFGTRGADPAGGGVARVTLNDGAEHVVDVCDQARVDEAVDELGCKDPAVRKFLLRYRNLARLKLPAVPADR